MFNNKESLATITAKVKAKIKNREFVFNHSTKDFDIVPLSNYEENSKHIKELEELKFIEEQTKLCVLNANNCNIKKVTIKYCPNLQSLSLSGSNIEEIHFEGKFPKLKEINLSNNSITEIELPVSDFPELQCLYLNNNKLDDLSGLAEFFIKDKFDFNINKNESLTAPPKEIVEQGKQKILEWFKQVEKYTTEKAYEAKILIVGEPGAGKTTLMELLFNRNFKVPQPEQPSTLGIEVKPNRQFDNPDKNLPKIKAHIWDFGGQDIQYMLHQYFLTDDSVYIFITDGRSGKTRYGYWFHIINLLGKKSPILIILNRNRKSDTIITFDERKYRNIFPELNIINCGEIDFANLNKSWEAFEEKLAMALSELPVVGQTIIKPWKKISEEVNKLRSKKYISLTEFEKICKDCGLNESDEIDFILRYYHKIGFALNFSDISLQSTVFLDPNWITHAIYDVLSDNAVIDINGEFAQEELYKHWQSKVCTDKHQQAYTRTECSFLLSLMLKDKFDICYQLQHKPGFYVVPMKLPDTTPSEAILEGGKKSHFRFQYPFMPEGIMSRLIVRLHEKIYHGNVWLSGAIFADKDNNKAEVLQQETSNEGLKYIGIKVTGKIDENRRSFLRTIREQIEYIHKNTFPYINYNEMIVCNCTNCDNDENPTFYSLDYIKSNLEGKQETVFCQKSKSMVPIMSMLHEVYFKEENKGGNREDIFPPNNIFISYSSVDRYLCEIFKIRLQKYLPNAKNKFEPVWSDVEIRAGADWNNEIQEALHRSNIGILLVSPMFLGSEYAMYNEFEEMLNRRKSEGYIIIPVLLRECNFSNNEELKNIQFVKTLQGEYDVKDLLKKDKLMPFDDLADIENPKERLLNKYFLKVSEAIDNALSSKKQK